MNTYQWDARKRLIGVSGSLSENFAYDPLGRPVAKSLDGVTTSFLYDRSDVTVEIGGGSVRTTYLRSLNINELFGALHQDGPYFATNNELGSTLALTNQSGASAVQ